MEQKQSDKIQYTVQYFNCSPSSVPSSHPIGTVSQNEPPLALRPVYPAGITEPIIEIVTAVDTINSSGKIPLNSLDSRNIINIRGTHMIIHSKILSQTVREVVGFYPG